MSSAEEVRIKGTVLMLDAPERLQFGVDWMEWTVASRFAGVKLIPFGAHFCFTRRHDSPGAEAQGFWLWVPSNGEGVCEVRRFEAAGEEFVPVGGDEGERLAAAVRRMEFDGRLGPYAQQADRADWARCTRHIDEAHVQWLRRRPAGVPYGDVLPKRAKTLDRSLELQSLEDRGTNVLGLMESCFVEFSLVHSLAAFELWRDVVLLMCGCVNALRTRTRLFQDFAHVLAWQLETAGIDVLWTDNDRSKGGGNVLVKAVSEFVADIQDDPDLAALHESVEKLTQVVPVLEVDDEDEPVVVDI